MRLTDYNKVLLALILRSVKVSLEDTYQALHCRRSAVRKAESWIRACDISEALVVITDEKIRLLLEENLSELGLEKSSFQKVSRMTADQIFLQYGRLREWQKWVGHDNGNQNQSSLIKMEFQPLWSTHHEHLLVTLKSFGAQIDLSSLYGYLVDPFMNSLVRESAGSE